jgi:hypothetical protein
MCELQHRVKALSTVIDQHAPQRSAEEIRIEYRIVRRDHEG